MGRRRPQQLLLRGWSLSRAEDLRGRLGSIPSTLHYYLLQQVFFGLGWGRLPEDFPWTDANCFKPVQR